MSENSNNITPKQLGLIAALQAGSKHLDDLQRLAAEFDNFRKRTARDHARQVQQASSAMVHALLPILDDLDLALRAAQDGGDSTKLVDGVKLVREKLQQTLTQVGVERIEAKDALFDPNLHDAVLDEGGDGDETIVIEELRPGYRLAEQVIRPSMVKVGRK